VTYSVVDSFVGIAITAHGFDFADEAVAKFEHPGELDPGHVVWGVAFVTARRFVLVVVSMDDAAPVAVPNEAVQLCNHR
jgi:hypothetical protein